MKRLIYPAAALFLLTACDNANDYDATGIFETTSVTVSAETPGKIISFEVVEGDSVRIGENIAVIDTTLLVLQLRQLESQQLSTESSSPDIATQASALRTQIAHQQAELERQSRLLADGATTQKIYDDTKAQLSILQGQLEALLSTLGKNRASISENAVSIHYRSQQIAEEISRSKISSPLTGTVLVKYAEAGEYAVPGKPLCKIADLDNMYLRAYFTANQLADIKIGQQVTVIADFGGEEQYEYPGTISWIAQESEFTPKTIQTQDSRANLVYAVKVAVKNDGRLKAGQYGEVRL